MSIDIKNRVTGEVIFTVDANSFRGIDLSGKDLRLADLAGLDFAGANLVRANLESANLVRANLSRANLSRANLESANLDSANLESANLESANLYRANLSRANLVRANLYRANLDSANLESANLESANLESANLESVKLDLFRVLDSAPNEAAGGRLALMESRVNGNVYTGECACLVGTIANIRGCSHLDLIDLQPDASSLAERWFLGINVTMSYKHPMVELTIKWIDEWIAKNKLPEMEAIS